MFEFNKVYRNPTSKCHCYSLRDKPAPSLKVKYKFFIDPFYRPERSELTEGKNCICC